MRKSLFIGLAVVLAGLAAGKVVAMSGSRSLLVFIFAGLLLDGAAVAAGGASTGVAVAQQPPPVTFDGPFQYAVGSFPQSVALDDLNGDGRPDLAVANIGGNDGDVSCCSDNGDGSLPAAAATFAAGTRPVSVAVGDLNGDGRPDLAVANVGSSDVSVLLARRRHLPGRAATSPSAPAPRPWRSATSTATAGPTSPSPTSRRRLGAARTTATAPSRPAQRPSPPATSPFSVAAGRPERRRPARPRRRQPRLGRRLGAARQRRRQLSGRAALRRRQRTFVRRAGRLQRRRQGPTSPSPTWRQRAGRRRLGAARKRRRQLPGPAALRRRQPARSPWRWAT